MWHKVEVELSRVSVPAVEGVIPAVLCRPRPAGSQAGVLVLMEAFGLTPHIEDVTTRIAREGYVVMAPDLYYRDLPNNKFGYDQINESVTMMLRLDTSKVIEAAPPSRVESSNFTKPQDRSGRRQSSRMRFDFTRPSGPMS